MNHLFLSLPLVPQVRPPGSPETIGLLHINQFSVFFSSGPKIVNQFNVYISSGPKYFNQFRVYISSGPKFINQFSAYFSSGPKFVNQFTDYISSGLNVDQSVHYFSQTIIDQLVHPHLNEGLF